MAASYRRLRAVKDSTIAVTSPGMVNSFAAMWTGNPSSRRVAEVTGPMDDVRMPSRDLGFGLPSNSAKFRTVEELVKVTTCGRLRRLLSAVRSRVREDLGTTVS